MFRNYLKTAIRSLTRNRNYTIINIAGLAVGIAVCILIFTIIQFHTSFDNFHLKKDRIYRVLTEYHHSDSKDIFYGKAVPFGLPQGLKPAFPQIEKLAPLFADHDDQLLIPSEEGKTAKKFKEENGVFYSTPELFGIFDYPLLSGSYTSLKDPNNALLTKEIADKYFGDWKTAVGRTLKLNNNTTLKITGILASIPANTDLQLKMVIAYGTGFTKDLAISTNWDNTNGDFGCYILLPSNTSVAGFNNQLRAFVRTAQAKDNKDSRIIQPLSEIHFDTHAGGFGNKSISRNMVNALWMIAAFILLIACINFINLSTAQAVNRAKEVGVRKVLGSNTWQLRLQFITETFLIVLGSVLIAVIIVSQIIRPINRMLDLALSANMLANISVLMLLIAIIVVVTILAGFYPSVVLSRFNPITALKSKIAAKAGKGISLRRSLVVFQFIIAQALIIGTLVIVKQMNYFSRQSLGFNKDAIVNVPFLNDSSGVAKIDYLQKQLAQVSGIKTVSFTSNTPIEDDQDNWTNFTFNNAAKETDFYSIVKFSDHQYVPTYELPLVAGKNMEASDTARDFLVNEMLVKNLGMRSPQEAIGKPISMWGGHAKGYIVGVLKDFNERSFRRDQAPLIITTAKNAYSEASIKLSTAEVGPTLKAIEKIWNTTFPDYVFEYKFLDEKVASFYKQESQLSQLYQVFAFIAIFLSCLGLYGLASFMAVQRIKEVGIRKVLGATAGNIVYLFSKEFILLIGVAFAIATPIAWFYMNQWLQDYPYRINLSWWLFLVGGAVSIVIAIATVSFQAIKAAVANPVTSLRSE